MPKICYQSFNFREGTLEIIKQAIEIIETYHKQGYDLSLRQLFYQFVSRALIPNTERSYKRLGTILNDARLAGLVDWDSITDRTRSVKSNSHWTSPSDIVEASANQYRIDKWEGQGYRAECWVEKDALLEVVARACRPLDVAWFSCRGYVSQSEMWRAAQRLINHEWHGSGTIVFHLGDHDPSGINMTEDIAKRLKLFEAKTEVRRIALTMEQIKEQNPPPNPAKTTDSRYASYVNKYGDESWELDALEPQFIVDLITEYVESVRDPGLWETMVRKEQHQRLLLQKAAKRLKAEMED